MIIKCIQRLFGRCYSTTYAYLSFCKENVQKEQDEEAIICVIDYKETIPFIPNIQSGHVIKVYDGDTITIASKLPYSNSPLYRFQVRLRGIDCPEIQGKNEDEKDIALCARKEMEKLVMQKKVVLKNVTTEKYGRLLADVYVNDIYVNEHLLKNRLAVPYYGKTKIPPENWKLYYEKGIMTSF
jgi:endonuclease YncB( thermonuclease family)